jgi:hypothetical protein
VGGGDLVARSPAKAVVTAARGPRLQEALERELHASVDNFSQLQAIERARHAQATYDEGAPSSEVFGVPAEGDEIPS